LAYGVWRRAIGAGASAIPFRRAQQRAVADLTAAAPAASRAASRGVPPGANARPSSKPSRRYVAARRGATVAARRGPRGTPRRRDSVRRDARRPPVRSPHGAPPRTPSRGTRRHLWGCRNRRWSGRGAPPAVVPPCPHNGGHPRRGCHHGHGTRTWRGRDRRRPSPWTTASAGRGVGDRLAPKPPPRQRAVDGPVVGRPRSVAARLPGSGNTWSPPDVGGGTACSRAAGRQEGRGPQPRGSVDLRAVWEGTT